MLSRDQLKASHAKYLTCNSLTKTSNWVASEFGVDINRHKLSDAYKKADLKVNPRNGFPEQYHINLREFNSPESKIASNMVRLAWEDIGLYLTKGTGLFNYMSACWFVSSELYQSCIELITSREYNVSFDAMLDITGQLATKRKLSVAITPQDIIKGREMYEARLGYWFD